MYGANFLVSIISLEIDDPTFFMIDSGHLIELSSIIYSKFKEGEKYVPGDIKSTLQDIYRDLGITSKPKATDLGKYFKLKRTSIMMPNNKTKEVFKLESLL